MKFAVSNIALPPGNPAPLLPRLTQLGVTGLDLCPNHLWPLDGAASPWSAGDVKRLRDDVESSGLQVVGMHDLLAGHPDLGLFGDGEMTRRTVEFVTQLSATCRDLGGRVLVFGAAGRQRGSLTLEQAWTACEDFLALLLPRLEEHGTVLCFEPTGESLADFCVTARECRLLVDHIEHPSLGVQLNAKALAENGEDGHAVFAAVRGRLDHFHANEPGLAPLATTGRVDHPDCRRHLASVSYKGWVTLQQRRVGEDPLDGLAESLQLLTDIYLRQDNLALEQLRERMAKRGREGGAAVHEDHRLPPVRAALDSVRPALVADGGDIELVGLSGDIVRVKLKGACTSCALASQTLGGVRRKLVEALGSPVRVVSVA